jgi:prolyl oligopeptidase
LYFKDTLGGEEKILIDPNTFSEDGTASLSNLSISNDGQYAAYSVSKAGSDWKEIFVKDINTGDLLDDKISWVKFSGITWKDNGFFYSRYDEPSKGNEYSAANVYHKVYYHQLGNQQKDDKLIVENKNQPKWNFSFSNTTDQSVELLYTSRSTSGYQLAFRKKGDEAFTYIDTTFNYDYSVLDNIGNQLLVKTSNGAPKYRLVLIDLENPSVENWKEIIPERTSLLESVNLAGGKIIVQYLEDVQSKLFVYDLSGKEESAIALPAIGIVNGLNSDFKTKKVYYTFENYTYPKTVFELNMKNLDSKLYWKPNIDFDATAYVSEQVFYTSKDGTKIPLFITYKKGVKRNGNNPTFLYAYGGFNISKKPTFDIENTVFLENGGVYAVANIRGGGEYGKDWHIAGTKENKQNVFDDFIAAAEYLIKEKYTNSQKLAVYGRSNGGLLIGAVMTQRPDLFKVCLPKVGVLDMLRYHLFTIGRAWAVDYGLSENEKDFTYLYKYSPLHNVKKINYPATLILTADHDDRVVPAHSFKFAATLQENQTGEEPIMIRVDINAGHGSGKPVSMQIDEFTDTWAFVFYNLGITINN